MKRGGPLKRGAPIPQVSKKRARENRQRSKVRDEVLTRDGFTCRTRGGIIPSIPRCAGPLDVHEVIGRGRGGSFLDPENCLTLCRRHHEWVTAHPREATELGLTASLPPSTPVVTLPPTTEGDRP